LGRRTTPLAWAGRFAETLPEDRVV